MHCFSCEKIIASYEEDSHLENITFEELFEKWLDYKNTITESPNTIIRHRQHYKKYLGGDKLNKKGVGELDFLSIQALCNNIVKEHNLTRKEWTNVKTILKGMFEYAVEKGYIADNPIHKVKILVKYRQENRKNGKTETYNTFEYKMLMDWLDENISRNSHPGFFAIKQPTHNRRNQRSNSQSIDVRLIYPHLSSLFPMFEKYNRSPKAVYLRTLEPLRTSAEDGT